MREVGDEVDRANELAARETEHHLHKARTRAAPEQQQNQDGSWPHTACVECGEAIEPGRIKLGKIRCYACQVELERLRSRR